VAGLVRSSEAVATSIVAYAEARAAFAKRYRENVLTSRNHKRLVAGLDEDWERYLIVHVENELVRMAGDLAEKHGLRGFDAIHLSSAITIRNALTEVPIVFSCSDQRLQNASQLEGFQQP
jgi:predicted nucleic acid-binding protein